MNSDKLQVLPTRLAKAKENCIELAEHLLEHCKDGSYQEFIAIAVRPEGDYMMLRTQSRSTAKMAGYLLDCAIKTLGYAENDQG